MNREMEDIVLENKASIGVSIFFVDLRRKTKMELHSRLWEIDNLQEENFQNVRGEEHRQNDTLNLERTIIYMKKTFQMLEGRTYIKNVQKPKKRTLLKDFYICLFGSILGREYEILNIDAQNS